MAAAHSQTDVLSRVRHEQRMRGKSKDFSGLRVVLAATAITLALLLAAFGAIGMLLMARAPQEPIASRLENGPYVAPQAEVPPNPQRQSDVDPSAQSEVQKTPMQQTETDAAPKAVKTLRVIAPPAETAPLQETAAQPPQVPAAEPETTASIPKPQPQTTRQVPQQQQRYVARPPAPPKNSQADNPLFQLFGIKQYR